MHTCPVCGYKKLRRPPDDYVICPSCGTEFGYTDSNTTHSDLQREWLAKGAKWHSRVIPQPYGWNGYLQLEDAGFIEIEPKSKTKTTTGIAYYYGQKNFVFIGFQQGDLRTESTLLDVSDLSNRQVASNGVTV